MYCFVCLLKPDTQVSVYYSNGYCTQAFENKSSILFERSMIVEFIALVGGKLS